MNALLGKLHAFNNLTLGVPYSLSLYLAAMNYRLVLFILLCSVVRGSSPPVSLADAFRKTLEEHPTPRIQKSEKLASEEVLNQAWGGVFPRISLIGNYTRQQVPDLGNTGNLAANFRPDQTLAKIRITQPLFHGFQEWATVRAGRALLHSQEENEKATQLELFVSLATSFVTVLSEERDISILQEQRVLTERRVKDLTNRTKIGRSRKGELLSAEAQLASLEAELEESTTSLKRERETLASLSGISSDTPLKEPSFEVKSLPNLEPFLQSVESHPRIQKHKYLVDVASEKLTGSWERHLPSIDLFGQYYLKRPGIQEEVKWDFGVDLVIPIFEGGATQSGVREASERKKIEELTLEKERRDKRAEITNLFSQANSLVKQRETLKKAVTLSTANYQEQNKDYRYGLVSNLEVLQALNNLQETQRNWNRINYSAQLAYLKLLSASGKYPEGISVTP